MTDPRVVTEALGGGPLARLAASGEAPPSWYPPAPRSAAAWRQHATATMEGAPGRWFESLRPAFGSQEAIPERLARVAAAGGVVVTSGQQPGLFGGPMYTWSKAMSALALADAIERETGIPAAPVFWAATDDADFAEAASTWIALPGGARRLTLRRGATEGIPMADVALGDVSEELALLAEAAGGAVDPSVLDLVRRAYVPEATVGSAYLSLLRSLFVPLGMGVIDASHPALLAAAHPLLARALECGEQVASALSGRAAELRAAGHEPQVAAVDGLSLVFRRTDGRKERVPLSEARELLRHGPGVPLSPNVLLRPVVERAILPTVAYLAGPGELAYFAQVGAVAGALGAAPPLALPRWSCTIIEPHVTTLLSRLGVARDELAHPHQAERRLARATLPDDVLARLAALREQVAGAAASLREVVAREQVLDPRVVEGAARQMTWRVDQVERRLVGAARRRATQLTHDLGTLRGALYPGEARQERALNIVPMLARHGPVLVSSMREAAGRHADALVRGGALPVDPA